MSENKNVWVLVALKEGQPEEAGLETLGVGRQLADDSGGKLTAIVAVGADPGLAQYGADAVLLLADPRLAEYDAEPYTAALGRLIEEEKPAVFLGAATLAGRDLAPRLAARLGTGFIGECTALSISPAGQISGTRLTHGGKLSSTILGPASGVQIATVKPGVFAVPKQNAARQAETRTIATDDLPASRIVLKGVAKAAPDQISLDEADVIVAGGKGIGSKDNFARLEELARRLGGVVAGSLGAVDEGWLTRKKLVGQTGSTVTPQLYIAGGISGSVYHVLGMKDSGFVIAINKDKNAPIFKVADMSIIGDASDVMAAVLAQLPEKTNDNSEAENAG